MGRICAEGEATYVNYNFDIKVAEMLTPEIRSALEDLKIKK